MEEISCPLKERLKNYTFKNGSKAKTIKVFVSDKKYYANLSKSKDVFRGEYYGNASSSSSGEKNYGYYITSKNNKIEIHK